MFQQLSYSCLMILFSKFIYLNLNLNLMSAYITVVFLVKFKIRVHQGVHKPFLSHFCLFTEIVCLFLQFSTLESCYIWLTISLEYPSAYVYSFCFGNFQNQGLSGGIRGCVNPILSHICLFSEILCSSVFLIGIMLYLVCN